MPDGKSDSTASEPAKKLAATIVKRVNESVRNGLGVNAELKPIGLETLIDLYLDGERKTERKRCAKIAEDELEVHADKGGEIWVVRRILDKIRNGGAQP